MRLFCYTNKTMTRCTRKLRLTRWIPGYFYVIQRVKELLLDLHQRSLVDRGQLFGYG